MVFKMRIARERKFPSFFVSDFQCAELVVRAGGGYSVSNLFAINFQCTKLVVTGGRGVFSLTFFCKQFLQFSSHF